MPEARALHKDSTLSNLSIQYKNADMIWPLLMPVVKVGKRSDIYYKYNKEDSFKLADDALGPKSQPNEVDYGVTPDNYSVKDHGLSGWVTQEEIDNADNPLQPEIDENDHINGCLDVAQEKRVSNIVFSAANYPVGNKVTLSGTAQWGGTADDPVGNLLTAIEDCFMRANTVVMGADAWKIFRKLPEILDAVKGSSRYQGSPGGLATVDEVKGLFEVDNWLVGRGRYNTAKEGQTPSYTRLWGKHCAALYVPQGTPSIKSIAFGLTFVEALRGTYKDFDGRRGVKGAWFIKTTWNSDEKIVAPDVGYFIENAVA